MEKLFYKDNINITYEDLINLNYIVESNYLISEKIKKNMILEKNIEQIQVLSEINEIHQNILKNIIDILEKGKVKIYE